MITGASGFLGRHLLSRFLGEGRDVIALTRDTARLDDVEHPRLRVIGTDYGPSLSAHLPASCSVIHLAARRNVPVRRPGALSAANVGLATTVARCVLERGARRLVNVSSAMALGSSAKPLDASDPLAGCSASAYVRSRVEGLLAVERVAAEGLSLVTLLPAIVYGPDHPRAPNRIASHIRRVLAMPFRIGIGGPQERRNLVYAGDVVACIVQAEQMEPPAGRHLVSGENVTQDELETEARAAAGLHHGIRLAVPRVAASVATRTLDAVLRFDERSGWSERLRTLLSPWCFRPGMNMGGAATPFAEGVRQTVEALLAGPGRWRA